MKNDNLIIDCFAGGGVASVGIEMALGRQVDIAINHDPKVTIMAEALVSANLGYLKEGERSLSLNISEPFMNQLMFA